MPPTVTIHTPCWNRADTLHRVFESLTAQTRRDFEWRAYDDGSTDGTIDVLERFAREADFDVHVHRFERRAGKPVLDNRAVREARGRFFLTADADDRFEPQTVERFLEAWETIPAADRADFAGVLARCKDQHGNVLGPPFPRQPFDTTFLELYYVHRFGGERWHFMRTDVLRAYPFPEVDYYISESVVWNQIGRKYRIRCIDDALRTYYLDTPGAVSKTLLKYPRGMAHVLRSHMNEDLDHMVRRPAELLTNVVQYGRLTRHVGDRFRAARRALRPPSLRALFTLLYPASMYLVRRDRRRGRVSPT